jgi:GNAT superfamily N-acetyltransferase
MNETNNLRIRRATIVDIPTIQDIAYRAWPEAFKEILKQDQIDYMLNWMYSEEGLERQLWIQNHLFALVFSDDLPVGFVGFEHDVKKTKATKIHKLYLLPEYKGKGIGQELMKYVLEKAINVGDETLFLNVNKYNKAVDFYKKSGFTITSEEVIDIGKGFVMDDFVMSCKIVK